MIRYLLGIVFCVGIGLLGCQKSFVFEAEGIDFELLGSGKIIVASDGNYKNYYVDVDAKEVYHLPLPERNSSNIAVDPKGRFIYANDGRTLYRAVPGEWDWETLRVRLPAGRNDDEVGSIYKMEVDPKNETLYFIWADNQSQDRPLIAMDLETGMMTNISQQLGVVIGNYAVNPQSGELLLPLAHPTDSIKEIYLFDPASAQLEKLVSYPLAPNEWSGNPPLLNWLTDGKEFSLVYDAEPDSLFRFNIETKHYEAMFNRHDLSYFKPPLTFSPDGERFAFDLYQTLAVDNWKPDNSKLDYNQTETSLLGFCEFAACFSLRKIYWWP